jgi:hypothetical protein
MNMIEQQIFNNAKHDNDDLAILIKNETNLRLKLAWKYHQFINWRIMSCVSQGNFIEAYAYATEMKRSIKATQVYVASLASEATYK